MMNNLAAAEEGSHLVDPTVDSHLGVGNRLALAGNLLVRLDNHFHRVVGIHLGVDSHRVVGSLLVDSLPVDRMDSYYYFSFNLILKMQQIFTQLPVGFYLRIQIFI
jgi:hypothetical protein